jgi:hypothetical protein
LKTKALLRYSSAPDRVWEKPTSWLGFNKPELAGQVSKFLLILLPFARAGGQ